MIALIVAAVVLIALVLFIQSRPADFRIVRSAVIPAFPAAVFAEVNDLHRWEAWSPWARMDPDAVNTFTGAESGVGSSFHWKGNRQVGEGVMTIVESDPARRVGIRLDFLKPFKTTNIAEFTFASKGEETLVTWSMTGRNNFASKTFGIVVNCDKMIGGMFESGLANLKTVTT